MKTSPTAGRYKKFAVNHSICSTHGKVRKKNQGTSNYTETLEKGVKYVQS